MNSKFDEKLKEFKEYLSKLEYLESTIALLSWDSMVNAPRGGIGYRSEMIGYLSGEAYRISTSDKMKGFIEYFSECQDSDYIVKAMAEEAKRNYDRTKKIPENEYKEYTIASSNSTAAWEEAKEKGDFNIFKPHLEKIVNYKRKFVEYLGYKENKYDTLLDEYEPGITTKKLDEVFSEVRDAIVDLLNKIKKSGYTPNTDFFTKQFPKEDQKEFSEFVLKKMKYDFEQRGRIDESIHPFTINFGNKDVRITTHYYENDFRSALFSCIHEGGHAIYEQNITDTLKGTMLGKGASMGIHESQSRFYENIIGKTKEFWSYFYPEALKRFPQFEGITLDEFYKGINFVERSLIRTEADELTYSLHIIIRYEIEKELINGNIEVEDLPDIWNKKYNEYLGIDPKNDEEGVLQDMHWSDGSFGYFPSYALGNLYGAQFLNKMEKDLPHLYEEIKKGNLLHIHEWLKENIHKYGAVYKPADLIKKVTDEELKAKYFIEYLNDKYTEIYNL
ncbi:carboxypeptidase M32 [Clostridium ganghwense]|uniref:Metal-dependent carboxypeptidase n=1 Tax=Clostridium ganghwense TaxID=312089 RepID=A0ABT4CUQ1_9CLOT|nr:carboxypeptidase M32 [Clostridium ganghwense]MCY6372786.1 carboxypeptidase M32 [Clostridium ganghwense]